MTDGTDADAYPAKAAESLASAEADFAAGRFNGCANRAYYACFQAAVAALARDDIRPSGRDGQWSHTFVQSRFVGQPINRRHRYPTGLREILTENRTLRQKADYEQEGVTRVQAERCLRRARGFARATQGGG